MSEKKGKYKQTDGWDGPVGGRDGGRKIACKI